MVMAMGQQPHGVGMEELREARSQMIEIAQKHGADNVRVFSSVARGAATAESNHLASRTAISFGAIATQDICKITIQPAPCPVYCDIKTKNGQPQESFFIRAGNQTKHLTKPSEITRYTKTQWP